MGITFSSPTPPLRKESPQPQYDTLSSFPLLATGNSISPYPDTARRRLATVAQQHASRQQQQDNDHSDLARRNTTHLRQPQNRHNWHRRQSEPAPVRAGVQRKGKGEDLGEVSGFMKAMNGEGGVWRL